MAESPLASPQWQNGTADPFSVTMDLAIYFGYRVARVDCADGPAWLVESPEQRGHWFPNAELAKAAVLAGVPCYTNDLAALWLVEECVAELGLQGRYLEVLSKLAADAAGGTAIMIPYPQRRDAPGVQWFMAHASPYHRAVAARSTLYRWANRPEVQRPQN